MREKIDCLLSAAHVAKDRRSEARTELERLLFPDPRLRNAATGECKSLAQSEFDAGKQRGTSSPHNEKMNIIEAAAEKLQLALIDLRSNQYSHHDFWAYEPFGPITWNERERPSVMWSIEAVRKAAVAAHKTTTRRRESENYNLAYRAAVFFRRFSEDQMASRRRTSFSAGNEKLVYFTQTFFSAVTGVSYKDVSFKAELTEATQRIKRMEKQRSQPVSGE